MKNPDDHKQKQRLPKRWVGCDIEEEYFGDDRKAMKMERKIASAKDRSKYKKTDRDKLRKGKEPEKEGLLRGRVLSITPQGYEVDCEGKLITCTLRGLLKKEKSQMKNLVAVGDFVLFEKASEHEGFISHVEPRRSMLSRADNLSRRKEQLIAANIDQVIITVSVVTPLLKPPLIDRYIIAARKGGMEPIIVINKIDLLHDSSVDPILQEVEKELFEGCLEAYRQASVAVIPVSFISGEGLQQLRDAMQNKASVFSGQSGVGKSSLINAITGLQFRTGKIVEKTRKGSHTTTTAQLLRLEFGGWCIDTPGIKSFGVWNLKREEVEQYFTEIQHYGQECKFLDCTHLHEQDCTVRKAVEEGNISPLRYESFQFLMEDLTQEHLRR